tara:strand:+ start:3973 stop:5034 length:1062 start_codon:yes stop_codon:yes gene_type:complete
MALGDLLTDGWNALKSSFSIDTGKKDAAGEPIYGTDWGQIASIGGLIGSATGMIGGNTTPPTGYQGSIPKYDAVRERVPNTYDPNRRPGSGGQRYFTDTQYVPKADPAATPASAEGIAALNAENVAKETRAASPTEGLSGLDALIAADNDKARQKAMGNTDIDQGFFDSPEFDGYLETGRGMGTADMYYSPYFGEKGSGSIGGAQDSLYESYLNRVGNTGYLQGGEQFKQAEGNDLSGQMFSATQLPSDEGVSSLLSANFAKGGIAQLKKGQYLNGASDGMADKVPANIDGVQEARLSDGEFVIPADVVSHLGNGNSDAGAKVLKGMMSRVRTARTGNDKQGKEINPNKFIPA